MRLTRAAPAASEIENFPLFPRRVFWYSGRMKRLEKIDSVRGIAALCVAITHTIGATIVFHPGLAGWRDASLTALAAAASGALAVIVFFVISGVVIGMALDRSADCGPFFIKRAFRLYPAHIVAICAAAALGWLMVRAGPVDLTGDHFSATIIGWVNGEIFNPLRLHSLIANLALGTWSMNWVGWTLYVEVTAAPLLPLFHRLSRLDNIWVDIAVFAALLAVAFAFPHVLMVQYWFCFYAGMVVPTRGRAISLMIGRPALLVLGCYALMVAVDFVSRKESTVSAATETIGAFGLLTVIVWHREAVPFLDHPILLALGRVSYSFYLWHLIVLRVWLRALYGALPAGFESAYALPIAAVSLMLTVSVAIVIAHLSYAYVERPGMKLGAQLASRLQNRSVGTGMVGPRPGARPAA